ncbi:hypothetical protein DES53_104491 [Roseimicrobium gellanilyticum]|uniref:Uncharacterized protein n=1 Tax=Roseimicrobium gellanilyticum TaxID=748857 RepID=A0A366HNC9_9BACT|nr:hypothetical protein [Roseimicrobium gellanilyticum]RBP44668.1 hypothetical protein DES53_104491 [Roseimicrobium gellanilyticum]
MHPLTMQSNALRSLAVSSLLFVLASMSLVRSQQPATPAPVAGYRIILRSSSEPYQVSTPDEPRRKNFFVTASGDDEAARTFGDLRRFRAIKFEKKTVPDSKAGARDASELTVMDLKTEKIFTLVIKQEQVVKD